MEASFEHLGPVLLIAVSGRLDTLTAPRFDEEVAPALAKPLAHVLVDMSGVTYISSAGLRSILHLVKHASTIGGRVGLFSVPGPIGDVIGISGFSSRLDIYPDRASALKLKAS
jgi:anti-anti-sigma factor